MQIFKNTLHNNEYNIQYTTCLNMVVFCKMMLSQMLLISLFKISSTCKFNLDMKLYIDELSHNRVPSLKQRQQESSRSKVFVICCYQ